MTILQDFQQRVVDELASLREKIAGLGKFLNTATYVTLAEEEKADLMEQYEHMANYAATLERRVARWFTNAQTDAAAAANTTTQETTK